MTYLNTWSFMMAGGVLYCAGKQTLGLEPGWSQMVDSAYWAAAALFFHWMANRSCAHSSAKGQADG